MSDNKNPYMQAAAAYGVTVAATDQRSLEGTVLLKAAQRLEALAERLKAGEKVDFREVGEIVQQNQKLWLLFVNDASNPEHPLPQEIKNNILSLGAYIFNRTKNVMIEPTADKLTILISINRNIAAGLLKRAPGTRPKQESQPQQTGRESADSFA